MVKSKLPPRSGSIALRQLNPILKKGHKVVYDSEFKRVFLNQHKSYCQLVDNMSTYVSLIKNLSFLVRGGQIKLLDDGLIGRSVPKLTEWPFLDKFLQPPG